MALNRSSIQKTHYDILSVKEDASHEQIRASYKAAILACHPDKLERKLVICEASGGLRERFLQVQKAWEILGNSNSRAAYDKELKLSRQDFETAEDVKLEEMMMEDNGKSFELIYQCRCGDYMSVSSDELGEMGIALESKKMMLQTADEDTKAQSCKIREQRKSSEARKCAAELLIFQPIRCTSWPLVAQKFLSLCRGS